MTNYERIKSMSIEKMAAEFMIFRPSDACFEDENRNYCSLNNQFHKHSQDCFKANVEWLESQVVADVQEGKHGRWIAERERQGHYSYCSECKCRFAGYTPNYKYCPNCGAKMDGEGRENE